MLHFVAKGALFNVVHLIFGTLKLMVAIFHALGAVFHGIGIIIRTTVQSLLHEGVNSPGGVGPFRAPIGALVGISTLPVFS